MMSKDDKNVTLQRMSLRAKRGNPDIKMPLRMSLRAKRGNPDIKMPLRMSLRAKRGNPVIKMPLMKSAGLPRRYAPDGTTDKTTSHLTNPSQDAGQVIGYSHSTDETTSQSTKPPKYGGKVAGYKPASWQVAGYRNDHLFGSGSSGLGLQSQSLRVGARFNRPLIHRFFDGLVEWLCKAIGRLIFTTIAQQAALLQGLRVLMRKSKMANEQFGFNILAMTGLDYGRKLESDPVSPSSSPSSVRGLAEVFAPFGCEPAIGSPHCGGVPTGVPLAGAVEP